jgi:hypothetical protein
VSDRVINLRSITPTIHLGNKGKFVKSRILPPDVVRIDRLTRWGNPFVSGRTVFLAVGNDGTPITLYMDRADSIRAYRLWLWQRLVDQPDFLAPLRGKRLACWCAPLPCHGDVIAPLAP